MTEKTAFEREFEDRLQMFCEEVEAANQYFFAFVTWHSEYAARDEVRALFDSHSLMTKTVLSGLQASMFLAIARVFDKRSAHSINTLLKFAQDHIDLFSFDALRARKMRGAPNAEEWIDDFMGNVSQPEDKDFKELGKRLRPYRRIYDRKLDAIRNRWFAHREVGRREANLLFANTTMEDFDATLGFLVALHEALWGCYNNGRPLIVDIVHTSPAEGRPHDWAPQGRFEVQWRITKEARGFLTNLASPKQAGA